MKLIKLALLLAIVLSAGSLLGYFNVSFNDTVLPNATRNRILEQDPLYPLDPGVANRWAVQLYGTGPDNQIDAIGIDGAVTDDDFVVSPAIHQNASFGMFFSGTGRWQPSGIRFFTDGEIGGGTVSQCPPGSKVYLRIYNNTVIASATQYFQFLIPYTVPSAVATVPVISGGYGWSAWAPVPKLIEDTYQLKVRTMPAGVYPILKGAAPTGNSTPWDSDLLETPATLIGRYTLDLPAGWSTIPAFIDVVAEDFTAKADKKKTISFDIVEPDTWVYSLQFNAPAGAYTINGVGAPYLFTDNDGLEPNLLLGDYTISAPPVGFRWAVNPITVVAGDFSGTKANHVLTASKNFVLVENIVDVVTPPAQGDTVVGDGTNGYPVGVTITGGGNNGLPGVDTGAPAVIFQINAPVGQWSITVDRPAGFGDPWYVYVNNIQPPMEANGLSHRFVWDFVAKGPIVITLDDNETLPVELSSFAATLTAQNFVKLTWVSQTETNLSGYRVLRSETNNQAEAITISRLIEATNTSQTATYNHVDNEVAAATTYYYWLEAVEMNGTSTFHGPTNVFVETPESIVPSMVTTMGNAYPNPFKVNTSTSIAYEVKAGETGTITIYNIIGQVVQTVPVSETTAPKTFTWNGRDSKGNACGSGIYFYKLSTPSRNVTKKMVIVN